MARPHHAAKSLIPASNQVGAGALSFQFVPRRGLCTRVPSLQMFVRLFVDENLDRIVPISKQPKEKIQAIIDSCTRQFPEFAERARKRIRTYLKSCRRNKRGREGAPWDAVRIFTFVFHVTMFQSIFRVIRRV